MNMDKRIQPTIHYAPESCAFCSGNGGGRCRDGEIYDLCPVCNGLGTVLVAQSAKKCAFCNGGGGGTCRDGYDYDVCPVCKGAGWAYVYEFDSSDK
jgi:DnaJ-class molecular chaperone